MSNYQSKIGRLTTNEFTKVQDAINATNKEKITEIYGKADTIAKKEEVLNLINNESRLPIPTRLADLETHISRREQIHL